MCIYASYVCSAGGGQRKALDPLQLEFQTVRMPLALIFLLLFVCLFVLPGKVWGVLRFKITAMYVISERWASPDLNHLYKVTYAHGLAKYKPMLITFAESQTNV